jgi:RNA polymerase sigma-70 factor (ECF subfamily)
MNAESYNQAINDFADRLMRFILKNINKDVETARDIVQNCFEALWKNKDNVEVAKCKSYLFTVAHNQIVDVYRKSGRVLYVENYHENEIRTDAPINDNKEIMHRALLILPTLQRSMVLLKDYEGYSYAEIANILNVTEGQVKINLFRARKKMKEMIYSPKTKRAL